MLDFYWEIYKSTIFNREISVEWINYYKIAKPLGADIYPSMIVFSGPVIYFSYCIRKIEG